MDINVISPTVKLPLQDDSEFTAFRNTGSTNESIKFPCGTPPCLVPELKHELQLQRQIEDKHYSSLVNLIISSTITICMFVTGVAITLVAKFAH